MSLVTAPLEEARENLRVIRQTMERSTKYSTLSGLSGVLIGLVAIAGVVATQITLAQTPALRDSTAGALYLAGIWLPALALAVTIEFLCNKRRASRVGKHLFSHLGAHILVAAAPAFLAGAVLTLFFSLHHLLFYIWGVWMLCYGAAICAVGLFSVRPVSVLGAAFVVAGALTFLLPVSAQLTMMAVTFGGFHIFYGILMARRHGW